jgi:hypothetical protein
LAQALRPARDVAAQAPGGSASAGPLATAALASKVAQTAIASGAHTGRSLLIVVSIAGLLSCLLPYA